MAKPRMTRNRMNVLLHALCVLESHYDDEYDDDKELEQAKQELDFAWQVLRNKWGHLLDEQGK